MRGISRCGSEIYTLHKAFEPMTVKPASSLEGLPDPRTHGPRIPFLREGCFADNVHLIENGLVKLTTVSVEGLEMIIGLRSAGWLIGAAGMLLGQPACCSAQTVTSCSARRISAEQFFHLLDTNRQFMRHVFSVLSFESYAQAEEQRELRSSTVQDRLLRFLNGRGLNGSTLSDLPLKQIEVAQLLGATPEHLNRLLRKMKHREELSTSAT